MPNRRAVIALASAGALAAAIPLTLTASSASAVTVQCQNTPRPVSGPVGCGTFFLPQVGYPHATSALALSAAGSSFGSRAEVEPMNGSPMQDWTAYQVCTGLTQDRSAAAPCGSGGKVVAGELVLRLSPGGTQPAGGVNSFHSLCLVDDNGRVGLGWCQSGAAFYDEGFPNPPDSNGVPPVVSRPNPSETWKLVKAGKAVIMVNVYSGRALDDAANGGPSHKLITYERNGLADQDWETAGCTAPYTSEPGAYGCITG
jgi:hypothetical protein